ncbi:MAG: FtsQ-type POTRA domain-containing protein [Treponema sp.]|jgi:cell division protein FtsQ|nr:FtsQ-type POTRA domain-containing protein [Treponema sp.]
MAHKFIPQVPSPRVRKAQDARGIRRELPEEPPPGDVPPGEEPLKGREGGGLERGIKVIIIAAASVLVIELVWLLVISPCMPLSRIEITGFPELERSEILLRGGIGERSSFISVDRRAVEKNLERIKEVESVRVTKQFPGTVKILLVPRVAVAMALTVIDGRQVPVYFDRHGVAFKTGGVPYGAQSLPVLSGLPLEGDTPLSALYQPLFAGLDRIRYADAGLLGAVSEIKVNKKPYDGFDIIMYPVHIPIRVRLESVLNEDSLRYIMLMLDVFNSDTGRTIEEIDFRAGTASYSVKEVSSGY